ncbi:hypothetical protein P879_06029 [Paragonimus westermani]|uniref:Uncharacterized protein n=1 Tax=Paragonimus westermani TaxID=34504 RepID=A0A8T0DRM0_9TREM|nr:hypothetical protein P879_06029 [Paragonimus westermani]
MDLLEEWFIEKAELIEEVDRQQAHSDHFQSTVDSSEWKDAHKAYVAKQYAQLRILESELKANQTRIEAVFQVAPLLFFRLLHGDNSCLRLIAGVSDWKSPRQFRISTPT